MSILKKILFLLSCLMIIGYAINYFFYKADLIQTLFGVFPMILLIIITQLRETQEK